MYAKLAVLGLACLVARADQPEDVLNRQRELNAVQIIYRNGVPHTDRQGRLLTTFNPEKSFFQIGMWGAPLPGKYYDSECDWAVLKSAGFNTVWPWAAGQAISGLEAVIDLGSMTIAGLVVDTAGTPVADAEVFIHTGFGGDTSDEQGRPEGPAVDRLKALGAKLAAV